MVDQQSANQQISQEEMELLYTYPLLLFYRELYLHLSYHRQQYIYQDTLSLHLLKYQLFYFCPPS